MKTNRTHWGACCAVLWLCACSTDNFAGVYQDEMGVARYEFQRDGRVYMTVLGNTVAADYQVDGTRVLVTSPQGTLVLTRQDGRLIGPMGLELIRQ